MAYSTFQPWIAFLAALEGQANTFEFGSAVQAAWPNDFGSGVFWRLKQNTVEYSIGINHIYTLSFVIRQAI